MEEKLLRLAEARIEVVPSGLANHFILTRDSFVCLIEGTPHEPQSFGQIGSVCKLTGSGFGVILWEGDQAYFVSKEAKQPATPGEIVLCRKFAQDLQTALAT